MQTILKKLSSGIRFAILIGSISASLTPGVRAQGTAPDPLEITRPSVEHRRLAALSGPWLVEVGNGATRQTGTADARTFIDGRFLDIDVRLGDAAAPAPYRFSLGFDRRHGKWSIIAWDPLGTYFVTASGVESDGVIRMTGEDDDPHMRRLGFRKKFVFALTLGEPNRFSLELSMVDTRTPAEQLMPFMMYRFTRSPARE